MGAAAGPCDVLIVAAFAPSFSALTPALGPGLTGRVAGLSVEARAVGIGLVAAAVGAAGLLRPPLPRAVILIGTCGAYVRPERTAPSVGTAVLAVGVRLLDVGVVSHVSELPPPLSTRCATDPALRAGLAEGDLALAEVATTLGITVDDEAAARMAATGADVEHLEAFAVGSACGAAGVAFAAVLGVANRVGSSARQEWRANHLAASGAAAGAVLQWLERGAMGLGQRAG